MQLSSDVMQLNCLRTSILTQVHILKLVEVSSHNVRCNSQRISYCPFGVVQRRWMLSMRQSPRHIVYSVMHSFAGAISS